jgi:hypothetical protein
MAGSGMGREISLGEFEAMTEKEKFAHVFIAVKAITHLEIAGEKATTVLEKTRSKFGAYNLKKNLEEGRRLYEEWTGEA